MQTIFDSKEDFVRQYRAMFQSELGKAYEDCDNQDRFQVLAKLVGKKAQAIAASNEAEHSRDGVKRIYYFSLEFLIGRLLDNYLLDFGVRDIVAEGISDMGGDLDILCNQEPDAGLGNGGLGRLAACFLDSMAHEGIVGCGNGMRYQYGLFKQAIVGGRQVEETDNWLSHGYPWEVKKPESSVIVRFGGQVNRHERDGKYWFTWDDADEVMAVPYDIPIVGYGGKTVNKLRIWGAEPVVEDFDLDAFNRGDYAAASRSRTDVEAISMILYPNDSGEHGRLLRLKQEYLFVSAGISSIIRTFHKEHDCDWAHFSDYVAIHTNDTHPAMCGAELMRVLVDEEGLAYEQAWDIVTHTLSYTNHTVLPEALEKWPINTFRTLLPRVYMYIDEIDHRYRDSFPRDSDNWQEMLKKTAILWDGEVRMANLSVICSHSVNGVAKLHTEILERDVLKDFYQLTPEKFNNKTNGVSHRRFLAESNPSYARLISSKIGEGWLDDADQLKGLEAFEGDEGFLNAMAASKRENKVRLARYVKQVTGVTLDPDTVFDVQVKRFHAYKRQLLNVFKILDVYNRILDDPDYRPQPTSFVFAGKAAQSYDFAKEVIRLINSVADVVNGDPKVSGLIKVAFVPNFAVSNAQLIYPAAEISEQISTAGKEASGTSNMKLMMNGAITLGTLDGANVEISKLAGEDNIKIFGMRENEVEALRDGGRYYAWDVYNADRDRLGRVVDELVDGTLDKLSGRFDSIHDALMQRNDEDFVLADFQSYVDAWDELERVYPDAHRWNRMALHNTANSGYFASDRTIREYASDIWHV